MLYCAAQSTPRPFFQEGEAALVYNLSLTFRDYSVSGLAAFHQEEEATHVVILSKFGFTVLDLMLLPSKSIWNTQPPGVETASRLKVVENTFRLLLLTSLRDPYQLKAKGNMRFVAKKETTLRVRSDPEHNRVIQAATGRFPYKSEVYFAYPEDSNYPHDICLKRQIPKIEMKLSKPTRPDAAQ